ncbi:efflux RND transporter permease subunit [Microbacterium gorillae]|uniref:efflux RND transporter permease subunit n=1 Tax=Microbacterium gorillae TaxID=1231063 RepID=UPI00058B3911|nr:efflux RND transporter permease subunit [Microbacterium gorillae]
MFKLAVLSLRNRALIALVTVVVAVFGALALVNLKQELIPSIEFPGLAVITTYPGAAPEVVNTDVSGPIETAVQGVPDLESSTATSTTNASIVQLSFQYGTNLATAEQKVTQAINRISSQLPSGVEPQVLSISIDDLPAIQLAVTAASGNADDLQARLESVVVPKLEHLDGVNAAQIVGGTNARVTIVPDPAKLGAAGFSQSAITDALKQNGILFPGGQITEGDKTLTVQTGAKLDSADDIAALPLVPTSAQQVQAGAKTVGDVASVKLERDPTTSLSRVDGKDALTIAVTKLPAANTVDVSKVVTDAIPDLEKQLDGAKITVIFDQAPYIQQSIESLAQEGLLGLLFAVIIILIFLMSVRSTLVTAISIPTSVLITFIGIQAFGYSLNILTLGALTMAIGRVVDDSIVVIENIKRHYVTGAEKLPSIILAVREVAGAITASTITTVAVFLPIAFVGDMTGELFRPFALTVTIAMVSSLLVALTIVPVLAYWFMRPGKPLRDAEGEPIDPEHPDAPPSRLQRGYLPILRWTLKHSWLTLLIAVLVLGGSVALAPHMKQNFLGDSGQNTFTMSQNLGPAASLESQDVAAQKVEKAIIDLNGVKTVQVSIGSSGSAVRDAFSGGSSGVTYSITTDPDADQEAVRARVQKAVDKLSDVGDVTIAQAAGLSSSDIEVQVTAPDTATLQKATDAVAAKLTGASGISQVASNLSASTPYIAVVVDRAKAAAAGLSEVAVGGIVNATMQPQEAGTIEIDDSTVKVYVQTENPPMTLQALQDLQIPTLAGPVKLTDVASVKQADGPSSITTDRGQRTATVTVTPSGDDLASASATVTKALDAVKLPQGANTSLGGVVSQQTDAFRQLGIAMLAAILIVYVVMVATFKSLRQPLLLLISIPFAATGAILLQIITGVPLGVASLIGVLMLIGIVVTNAIVLVDLVNQYRKKGLSAHDATVAGSSMRLRPILMTALATIFALTPMALGITGHGGFISQPLAIVVIGGLVSSTVLTLLVLPTLYNLVEGAKERRAARRAARVDAERGSGPLRTGEVAVVSGEVAVVSGEASAGAGQLTRRELRHRDGV